MKGIIFHGCPLSYEQPFLLLHKAKLFEVKVSRIMLKATDKYESFIIVFKDVKSDLTISKTIMYLPYSRGGDVKPDYPFVWKDMMSYKHSQLECSRSTDWKKLFSECTMLAFSREVLRNCKRSNPRAAFDLVPTEKFGVSYPDMMVCVRCRMSGGLMEPVILQQHNRQLTVTIVNNKEQYSAYAEDFMWDGTYASTTDALAAYLTKN